MNLDKCSNVNVALVILLLNSLTLFVLRRICHMLQNASFWNIPYLGKKQSPGGVQWKKVFCNFIKVAPTVEKTGVFKKGWNFASWTCFASCIIEKTLFSIIDKRNSIFSYYGIIFYSVELFDWVANFKFTWTSLYF